jgi:hypothetical protein
MSDLGRSVYCYSKRHHSDRAFLVAYLSDRTIKSTAADIWTECAAGTKGSISLDVRHCQNGKYTVFVDNAPQFSQPKTSKGRSDVSIKGKLSAHTRIVFERASNARAIFIVNVEAEKYSL